MEGWHCFERDNTGEGWAVVVVGGGARGGCGVGGRRGSQITAVTAKMAEGAREAVAPASSTFP